MKFISSLTVILGVSFSFAVEANDCDLMRPDNPTESVPATVYHSPFTDYKGFKKLKVKSWREVNDKAVQSGHNMGNMKNMNMNEGTTEKKLNEVDHSRMQH
ncbi:hypothetical protein [Candidatus Berkiella aquae]|uniref:Uncharacterized protein n=1 Tax=Candidatus Berkiella aquae TaxID=295108 RepID=A0A0Q9YS05_9GAMM|nr:hypothetical protein [Candidatus Berkiella aquae]MCS5712794.1 hypothetical protein [Candidatus Berkiella aquae]